MQIKHSMNLINLRGWPRPAGWNSGRPVGSVVLIYSAIALQWFIYLIGMNSKDSVFLSLLAFLSHPQFHTHNHAYILLDELFILIKEEKETHLSVLFSQVRAHLWDAHCTDAVSAFRHINETVGWLMCICCLSFPFSSHLIHLGSWWARAYPSMHWEGDSLLF